MEFCGLKIVPVIKKIDAAILEAAARAHYISSPQVKLEQELAVYVEVNTALPVPMERVPSHLR